MVCFSRTRVSIKAGKPSSFHRFSTFQGLIFVKDHSMVRLQFVHKTVSIKPGKSWSMKRVNDQNDVMNVREVGSLHTEIKWERIEEKKKLEMAEGWETAIMHP